MAEHGVEVLLNIVECASALKLTADHVRRLCKKRVLGHRRIGMRYYFTPQQINEYRKGTIVPAERK